MKNFLKKNYIMIIVVAACLVGSALLLYPSIASWWNERHQSRAIATYQEAVEDLTDEEYEAALEAAREYNEWLYETDHGLGLTDEELEEYESILNINGDGIIGYVEIPVIDVYLPIYHTTEDSVLAVGLGHLEGSSFPVGGENTHAVITGHTGLPSAELFTNLSLLEEGDIFYVYVLDEMYTYEVEEIFTVLPDEIDELDIFEGEDYVTLLTCTPYGLNTNRLLVRGTRIENPTEEELKESEAVKDRSFPNRDDIAAIIALAVLAGLVVLLVVQIIKAIRNRRIRKGKAKPKETS